MLKQLSALEHKIGDKVFSFFCEPTAQITEVKDALFAFIKFVGQVEDTAKANAEAQAAAQEAEKPAEENKVEPIPEQPKE